MAAARSHPISGPRTFAVNTETAATTTTQATMLTVRRDRGEPCRRLNPPSVIACSLPVPDRRAQRSDPFSSGTVEPQEDDSRQRDAHRGGDRDGDQPADNPQDCPADNTATTVTVAGTSTAFPMIFGTMR